MKQDVGNMKNTLYFIKKLSQNYDILA